MYSIMSISLWIDKSFLTYDYYVSGSTSVVSEEWQQQYEIYKHVASILGKSPDNNDLASAVFQLNRAIDFREKLLNKQYSFKKIPGFHGKKQHEIMHSLGIIQPLLKTKLDKIRNNVMHSATYPVPKLSEVAELTEFTWYFLKSTDLIASRKASSLEFNAVYHDNQSEWAEMSFSLDNWEIDIRGGFLNQNVRRKSFSDSVEIVPDTIEQKEKTTYISGKLLGPVREIQEIAKIYFAAL